MIAHTLGAESPERPADSAVRRRAYPGRWITAAIAAVIVAMVVKSLVTNQNYHWDVIGQYVVSGQIVRGLGWTLALTGLSMLIGIVLGTVIAVCRQSSNPTLSGAATIYIWIFRGSPLLVQLIFWYNLSALYPTLELQVPFTHIAFASAQTNSVISPLTAALLGLGLNQAAYTAEIVRAGILSVPRNQVDAATSLGMSRLLTMRRVILPQAMRVIIPPIGNETIGMLKTTSIVSVLAMPELLYSAQLIYARNYQTIPLLFVATIWYLIVTSILTLAQSWIERRYSATRASQSGGNTLMKFVKRALTFHSSVGKGDLSRATVSADGVQR